MGKLHDQHPVPERVQAARTRIARLARTRHLLPFNPEEIRRQGEPFDDPGDEFLTFLRETRRDRPAAQ
ncbi:MAG: hypothetical protein KF858_08935 [Candidatus Sumerlaeia bacterium]|nr:hypothetical protein [Candidatus Sumerlaeia bacterium]